MAGETVITVVGNLTADPEIRTIGSGAAVASFTIASTPRTWNRNSNQFEDGQALFLRCSAWRDMAEHCAQSLSKGMRVIAQGRLQQRSYQAQDGSQRTVIEMQVDEIGPSLRYATAQVTRQSSSGNGGFSGNRGGYNNANNNSDDCTDHNANDAADEDPDQHTESNLDSACKQQCIQYIYFQEER